MTIPQLDVRRHHRGYPAAMPFPGGRNERALRELEAAEAALQAGSQTEVASHLQELRRIMASA